MIAWWALSWVGWSVVYLVVAWAEWWDVQWAGCLVDLKVANLEVQLAACWDDYSVVPLVAVLAERLVFRMVVS